MRSKHDKITFLDQGPPPQPRTRHAPSAVEPPLSRSVRHPEYPLERVCSYSSEPFQLTFARNAQQHFLTREGVEVVASHQGLTIRGETEDAIDAAIAVLLDLYGPRLRLGPATIRYHRGVTVEQPWMGLHVRCPSEHLDAVNDDLVARDATIIACEFENARVLIQARAPLVALLGYRSALRKLTGGSAQQAMWLSHYAPVEHLPPPGGEAA